MPWTLVDRSPPFFTLPAGPPNRAQEGFQSRSRSSRGKLGQRVVLPGKGYHASTEAACSNYRRPWNYTEVADRKPLENVAGDCARNCIYQVLMSIPVLVIWLNTYHGPACHLDHCPGCELLKVYKEIYPDNAHQTVGQVDYTRQRKVLRQVDNFWGDKDNFFMKNNLVMGLERPLWDKIWIGDDAHQTSIGLFINGTNDRRFITFVCEALILRHPPAASEDILSMFRLHLDTNFVCRSNSDHNEVIRNNKAMTWWKLPFSDLEKGERPFSIQGAINDLFRNGPLLACPICKDEEHTRTFYTVSDNRTPETVILEIAYWGNFSKATSIAERERRRRSLIDDIDIDECLDLTRFLSDMRRAEGERSVYRLSAISLIGLGPTEEHPGAHAVTVVRTPDDTWLHINNNQTNRRPKLSTLLSHPTLDNYIPSLLIYVKAVGDTTAGDALKADIASKNLPVLNRRWRVALKAKRKKAEVEMGKRILLPGKGFLRSTDPSCQRYRIPWATIASVEELPRLLPNEDGHDYRNAIFQSLFSIPVLTNWLSKYHSPESACTVNHCPGCYLRKVYMLMYPPEHGNRNLVAEQQIIQDVMDIFADKDGYLKANNILLPGGYWQRSNGINKGRTGLSFLRFIVKALEYTSEASRDDLEHMFGLIMTEQVTCPKDAAHVEKYRRKRIELSLMIDTEVQNKSSVAASLDTFHKGTRAFNCSRCKDWVDGEFTRTIADVCTPEVVFIHLDWADNYQLEKRQVKDHVKFSDCLDLTQYLQPERRAKGERALYRLASVQMDKLIPEGPNYVFRGTAVVRRPDDSWSFMVDNNEQRSGYASLTKAMKAFSLRAYHPSILIYVKANGDTTSSMDENQTSEIKKRLRSTSDEGNDLSDPKRQK